MDPVSVISLIQGATGLAVQCLTVAKTLNDIVGQFKNAKLTIMSLKQEVGTLELAWKRIAQWSPQNADPELIQKLNEALECGTIVMSALQDDLANYAATAERFGFKLRAKTAWNEKTLLDHQTRIRGQAQAMSLLLQITALQNPIEQTRQLEKSDQKIRNSHVSAYSIVPSWRSSRASGFTNTANERDSGLTVESAEMVYRRLSFEDELFTAAVYKRNYRTKTMRSSNDGRAADSNSVSDELQLPPRPSDNGAFDSHAETDGNAKPVNNNKRQHFQGCVIETSLTNKKPNSKPFKDTGTGPNGHIEPNHHVSSLKIDSNLPLEVASRHLQKEEGQRSLTEIRQAEIMIEVLEANTVAARSTLRKEYNTRLISVLKEFGTQAAFHRAVEDAQYEYVMFLLTYGARVDSDRLSRDEPASAWRYTVRKDDFAMAKLLLRFMPKYGMHHPTELLRYRWSPEITMLLIGAGAAVSLEDELGYQPLHDICGLKSAPEAIKELIKRGADIEAPTAIGFRKTPLQIARSSPYLAANVKALLELGAKDDIVAPQFETPLHAALLSRNLSRTTELLRQGVDPNVHAPKSGLTSILILASAIYNGYNETRYDKELFRLLMRFKTNLGVCDRFGNQILHFLVQPTWYERPPFNSKARARRALIRCLMANGANCNARDNRGETPLSLAVQNLNAPVVEDMFELGGHLSSSDLLRLRVRLHAMHSKSGLRPSWSIINWKFSYDRDSEINDILRLLNGECGFIKARMSESANAEAYSSPQSDRLVADRRCAIWK